MTLLMCVCVEGNGYMYNLYFDVWQRTIYNDFGDGVVVDTCVKRD